MYTYMCVSLYIYIYREREIGKQAAARRLEILSLKRRA